MPKRSDLPLEVVTVRLYKGDKEVLGDFYPELKYNAATREIIHRHCRRLLELEARRQPQETPANDGTIQLPGDTEPLVGGQA